MNQTVAFIEKESFMLKKYLWVFFISMLPVIELRGAIPVSQGLGLPLLQSYIIAVLGNMLPVPFIYLFARKILTWGADKPVIGKPFTWCLQKGEKGGKELEAKAGNGLFIALMIFVAIPLPGTGAWTGALIAALLKMNRRDSFLSILLGVTIAGTIITLGTYGVLGFIFK